MTTQTDAQAKTQEQQQQANPQQQQANANPAENAAPNPDSQLLETLRQRVAEVEKENSTLSTANQTLSKENRELLIKGLPPEKQEAARKYYEDTEQKSDLDEMRTQLGEQARHVRAGELYLENHTFGVTKEKLLEDKTLDLHGMEALAARMKADFLEAKVNGTANGDGQQQQQAHPGRTPSDNGAPGNGNASDTPFEGTNRKDLAKFLGQSFNRNK